MNGKENFVGNLWSLDLLNPLSAQQCSLPYRTNTFDEKKEECTSTTGDPDKPWS